jgi:hypothetical protein
VVVDGLKGFREAIAAVFLLTTVQTCIIHLIRNSLAWTCIGKVESSPMSNEELDDAPATVYERI